MGRNRVPPEVAVLRGNPRKTKLRRTGGQPATTPQAAVAAPAALPAPLDGELLPSTARPSAEAAAAPAPEIDYPEFLTGDVERAVFRVIMNEFLPRNVARDTDYPAYGRYAAIMALWVAAKHDLDQQNGARYYTAKSKHNPDGLLRRNPAFQDMIDLNAELRAMEVQLGLTPLARQLVFARLNVGAGQAPGGELPLPPTAPQAADNEADGNALGYLGRSATPIDKLN